jgi:uncharacterized protein YndB with AHSA1/START domain
MNDHAVIHDTFTLERRYAVPAAVVFGAFASEQAKDSWGVTDGVAPLDGPGAAGEGAAEFNFRVGGREFFTMQMDGTTYRYDARYYDIVPDRRLVYSYEMYADGQRISVSLATIAFIPRGEGTLLAWTEQGTFLDGHLGADAPALRKSGTAEMLDGLAAYLQRESAR